MKHNAPPLKTSQSQLTRFMHALGLWLMGAAGLVISLMPAKAQRRAVFHLRKLVIAAILHSAARRARFRFGDDRLVKTRAHGPKRRWSRNCNLRLVAGVRLRRLLRGRSVRESLALMRAALADPENCIALLEKRIVRGMSKALARMDYVFACEAPNARVVEGACAFADTS